MDEERGWRLFFDTMSRWLIIFAAIQVGLQSAFGINCAGWLLGGYGPWLLDAMGVAGVWQLFSGRDITY